MWLSEHRSKFREDELNHKTRENFLIITVADIFKSVYLIHQFSWTILRHYIARSVQIRCQQSSLPKSIAMEKKKESHQLQWFEENLPKTTLEFCKCSFFMHIALPLKPEVGDVILIGRGKSLLLLLSTEIFFL